MLVKEQKLLLNTQDKTVNNSLEHSDFYLYTFAKGSHMVYFQWDPTDLIFAINNMVQLLLK
jgi:hypothetical protein